MKVADPADPAQSPLPGDGVRRRRWLIALGESTLCLLIAVVMSLVAAGMAFELAAPASPPDAWMLLWLADLALGLLLALLIGPLGLLSQPRIRIPLHLVLTLACGTVAGAPAGLVALVRIGRERRLVLDAVALGLAVSSITAYGQLDSEASGMAATRTDLLVFLVIGVLFTALFLLWGHSLGTRQALLESLRDQARAAQAEKQGALREARALAREREADVALARAQERAAIARDMHDSLSHHLSVIAMHAGALASRSDLSKDQVHTAAQTVRDAAGAANAELREVLTTLRSNEVHTAESTSHSTAPLPTGSTLNVLIEQAVASGQQISAHWDSISAAELEDRLPTRAALVSVTRILAELLLNARKHAPHEQLDVRIAATDTDLVLRTSNSLPHAGDHGDADAEVHRRTVADPALSTGHGLIGVQERARMLGGEMHCEAGQDQFEVEVRIPW